MTIKTKITIALLLMSGTLFTIFILFDYSHSKEVFNKMLKQHLVSVSAIQEHRIQQFIEINKERIKEITNRSHLQRYLDEYLRKPNPKILKRINEVLMDAQNTVKEYIEISVVNNNGTIIASTNPNSINTFVKYHPKDIKSLKKIKFPLNLSREKDGKTLNMDMRGPIFIDKKLIASILITKRVNTILDVTQNYTGLGDTGETVLAQYTKQGAQFLVPLRFDSNAALNRTIDYKKTNVPIIKVRSNHKGYIENAVDYRGEPVFSVLSYIDELEWGMIVKIDKAEARKDFMSIYEGTISAIIIIIPVLIIFAILLARNISRPIVELTQTAQEISKGKFTKFKYKDSQDEISILGLTFNTMMENLLASQNELSQSQKFLSKILEGSLDGIVTINSKGIIQSFNPMAEKLFGYKAKEVINKNVKILIPSPHFDNHDKYIENYLKSGIAKIIGSMRELEGKHKKGHTFPILLGITETIWEGEKLFTATVHDISERKKYEMTLVQNELMLNEAQRIAQVGHWEWNIEKNNFKWSSELCRIWNVEVNQDGIYPYHLFINAIHEKDIKKVEETFKNALKNQKAFSIEFRIIVKNKTLKYIRAVGEIKLDEKNKPTFLFGTIANISEQRIAEKQLIEEKKRADMANKAKSKFLANMSHEIRTPMNAIIGFTEIALKNPELNNEIKEYLDKSLYSAKGLLHIINDILDISKVESGKFELEYICFNLSNLVKDVLKVLKVIAHQKFLELELDIDTKNHHCYKGDPNRIKQVLMNIIGNAIKFTKKGKVSVSIKNKNNNVLITIKDTGIGMSKNEMENIFNPFVQADNSTSRQFGGTGLGTTISKHIINLMGGEIWLESEKNIGTTFYIEIPLPHNECMPNCEQYEQIAQELAWSPRLFNILLAEDNQLNGELIELNLGKELGHKITWVKNGKQAVELCKDITNDFDLILMDIQMPILDGVEATKEIRKQEKLNGRYIPIIALTASATKSEQKKCIEVGMDGFARKPLELVELLTEMEMIVPKKRGIKNNHTINETKDLTLDLEPLKDYINIDKGLKNWLNKKEYLSALIRFSNDHKDDGLKLEELIKNKNSSEAQRVLHTLKGLSLGLDLISNEAEILEQKILSNDTSIDLNTLQKYIDKTVYSIKNVEEKVITEKTALKLDKKQISLLINDLILKLNIGDYDKTQINNLNNLIEGHVDDNILKDFKTNIDNFEFEEASKILKFLKENI